VHAQAGHTESSFCADVKQDGESEDHPERVNTAVIDFIATVLSSPYRLDLNIGRAAALAWRGESWASESVTQDAS
jgi:hypothetical protein